MILGMTTATYTLIHVLISLVGIGTGFVVMYGLLGWKAFDRWTALFLTTTVLTSVTGFGFPFDHLTPANKVGIISLVVLAIAIVARYSSPRWSLAPDVRHQRRDCAVSQYVCPGRAVVRKGASPESDGSHAERAAVFGRATRRSGALRRANDFRGEEVPQRSRVPAARSAGKAA